MVEDVSHPAAFGVRGRVRYSGSAGLKRCRRKWEVAHQVFLGATRLCALRQLSIETHQAWFQDYLGGRRRNVLMRNVLDEMQEVMGVACLPDIEPFHRHDEFAVVAGAKEHRGKGQGTAAARVALGLAFADVSLNASTGT